MKFAMVGVAPAPAKLAPIVAAICEESGSTVVSLARTQEAVEFARRHGSNRQSQEELYACWEHKRRTGVCNCGSCNPANPPGQSTHEGRNDGVAYPGPARMVLRWWQWGIDLAGSLEFVRAANAHGFSAAITYPGNPLEGHHANLRRKPSSKAMRWVRSKVFPVLKKGSKGKRVGLLTKRLHHLGWLHDAGGGGPTGLFNERVEDALQSFQRHYGQKADGVYGFQTDHQLKVALRAKRSCRKAAGKIADPAKRDQALERCNRKYGPDRAIPN